MPIVDAWPSSQAPYLRVLRYQHFFDQATVSRRYLTLSPQGRYHLLQILGTGLCQFVTFLSYLASANYI